MPNFSSEYSRKVEDYLEAIYNIEPAKGHVSTTQLSEALGVKCPSVTEMLAKLSDEGLVSYKPYHGARLTKKGKSVGESVAIRHYIILNFLMKIGVEEDIARRDACIMEHELSPQTVQALRNALD